MTITKPERLSYSIKEFSEKTGISIDVLKRHIDGHTDTPLTVSYPSAKGMILAVEGQRWLESLQNERP